MAEEPKEELDLVGLFHMFASVTPGQDPTMSRKDITIAFKVYFYRRFPITFCNLIYVF
jgi:hypothetical protein